MDGESSYESDISESWSLIDINLNEESLSVTDASESPTSELKNGKLGKENELEIEDFVRKCKETNKAEFNRVNDSESVPSFKGQESCSRTDDSFLDKKNFSDDAKNDSGDSESIEILELDGNYRDSELDRLDVSGFDHIDITYQSDDEESLEGNSNTENRSNNSTVIRRRKRLSNPPEDIVHSVNSENESGKKKVEGSVSVREIAEEWSRGSSPVYKHYRNNVVNTVLSLSVGVIFAGVACLAIGHFLGVQDASETAVELAETLKKLQAENAALQSALLTLEMNSKSELPSNQPQDPPIEQALPVDPSKTQVTDLNGAVLSAVRPSLNSVEWLSKLHSFIGKNKLNEGESGVELNGLGKYILDQVHSLNRRMEDGAKFFEDADKKISKYLQRIIKRLSSSQDNIEVLHERLIKLKDTLNSKPNRVTNSPDEVRAEKQVRKKVPVTELDLQTMQWGPERKSEKSLQEDYRNSILFYNFPQPEKYYKNNSKLNQTARSEKQENKKRKDEEKKKAKKQAKNSWKKEKSKEKKEKKGNKKRKWAVNKFDKAFKKDVKSRQKDKTRRATFKQVAFNLTNPQSKKHQKSGEKAIKHKRKCKKCKHTKPRKVSLSNLKRESYSKRNRFSRMCSGPQCFNLTGHWVFKWADGREEFRRNQAVGEWQFDRAKARGELRGYNFDENWQFRRAVAREYNRGKYEKYFGKDFFHERFSWI